MQGDTLLLRESFIYDEDFLLVEKRVFDGRVETYEKWERDGQTGLVIKTNNGLIENFYEYDKNKNLVKEGNAFNQILFTYDEKGRMDGQYYSSLEQNTYKFNIYGLPNEIKEIGSGKKYIKYNTHNLPIICSMNGKVCINTYDNKGRIIKEKISNGAETSFAYDEFGRVIKKTLPEVLDENGEPYFPEIFYEYDTNGNVICETSPSGAKTISEYNIFKKPIKTIFPDGSIITNSYYNNGELKESVDKDGTKTRYVYDALNRLILKQSELFEERWEYDGRVLKSYTDPSGLVTIYEYDEFLRKISEDCEGRKKEFFYDRMGYVCLTKCGELFNTEEHDTQGRVIQTSQNGFNKISYEYDKEGRKKKAIKHTEDGDATDLFFWDEEGALIKHIDPLGGVTEYIYDGNNRIEIDPTFNRSIEVFDALKRVVRKEKRSKDGELTFAENFFYDRGGNLKRRYTEVHDLEVEYDYDLMGRVILETESAIKKTSFCYDIKGRVATKTTPNGVTLEYKYDCADRILELKATDNSVWYEYEYTGVDLTKITDLILGKTLEQKYTKFHEVCEEVSFSGFKTSWYYDLYGRKKEVYLPDGSSIFYSYRGGYMNKVSRYDKNKKLLYQHEYTKFDLNHHVKEEKLPFYFGIAKTCRDFMQRPISLESPFHKVGVWFNLSNLITKKMDSIGGNKEYFYDSLNQLTKEGGINYNFDSLGNPKEYEINNLNQIVSTDSEQFSYDSNGNLIKRNDTFYTYDALNRLTAIEYPKGKKVTFTYDPLSRLVSKNNDFYLYDGEFEIGKINKQGRITELKVLGLGVKGDVGASIMLEFFGRPYIPLHDLQGNIIAIIDRFDGIAEKFEYNAFGETKHSNYTNPWRFCSKRSEEGLIFFGKRFYDPKLKRWLSPDPLGFKDSRNLYQFNLNDPLNRLDQFGLESEFYFRINNDPNFDYSKFPNHINPCPFTSDNFRFSGDLFGTAIINGQQMELLAICNREYTFTFTDEEKSRGYFNMMDHIPDLLKGAENQIGLVSYMNGMNCSTDLFKSNTHAVAAKCPQGALVIGIYNQTEGLFWDCFRVFKELLGFPSKSAYNLAAFFKEEKEIMSKHCPKAKSLHICHSEGGIICKHARNLLSDDDKKWMHKNVHILALGPLSCIPKTYGIDPRNCYAKQDWVTGPFAKKNSAKYNVAWVNLINGPEDRGKEPFPGHDFQGYTYSNILKKYIENSIEDRGGFYVGDQR
jgi:RHS repeat-associated protein